MTSDPVKKIPNIMFFPYFDIPDRNKQFIRDPSLIFEGA